MQFLFCESGGEDSITLKGEIFNYIFKVRRHKSEKYLHIRNPQSPKILYKYLITEVDRRKAILILENSSETFLTPEKLITLGWCVVDSKTIEKTLPMLNELGIQNIYFIYCDYSQQNIKLDFDRFQKILQSSSMQSGRFNTINLYKSESLDIFLKDNPETVAIDFSNEKLEKMEKESISILVGSEGGFSEDERTKFRNIRGLDFSYILRSQTAVISAISIIN